ncbi:adhesion domain-containing protein [Aeromonas caviae]|uniref:adhesion domain-containing protein n=1 Tax=Aeromonas caviae TaxID=648 RepID=UPI0038D1F7FA
MGESNIYKDDGRWRRQTRTIMASALLLGGLSGCGGGEGDAGTNPNTPAPSPVGKVTAVDGFGVVRPSVATRIDLSAFARGPNATLTAMSSQQEGCQATNLSGLSAELTNDSGLCEYTYTVSNSDSNDSAALNVLASSKASPVLPPLSQTMMLGTGDATYDLGVLLGSDWPADYSLDPDSLEVQGGTTQGTVTANGNVLTYTPPSTPDWNRIVFILKHPDKPDEDALGTLYVTVSDASNQAPTIGEPKYDHQAQTGSDVIAHQTVTLDLATLPNLNIVDPEGEDWQLVEVQSYSASVVPVNPTSVTNKQFTFTAGSLGEHIVSYIVGDHKAGFTSGLIKVMVGADERAKTWADINVGEQTYKATPLYSDVTSKGIIAEGVWDTGVSNTIGAVSGVSALQYCSNGTHLASKSELDALRTTPEADSERKKYPVQRDYIVINGANYLTYNLQTGATAPYVSGSQYAICVTDTKTMMSYVPKDTVYGTNTGLSDDKWWPLGTLTSTGGVQGNPVVIDSTDIGPASLSDANVRLNPAGCPDGTCVLEVQGDPTRYGNMIVQLTNAANPDKTISIGPLTLLQNARVVALRNVVNASDPENNSANTVVVTVVDKDNNPVADTQIKLKHTVSSRDVTVTPGNEEAVATSRLGEITMFLRTSKYGEYVLTFPDDAVVGGLPTEEGYRFTFKTCIEGKCFSDATSLLSWDDANDKCVALGGQLPTISELKTLYQYYPNGQLATSLGFITTEEYWSSTIQESNNYQTMHPRTGVITDEPRTNRNVYVCVWYL